MRTGFSGLSVALAAGGVAGSLALAVPREEVTYLDIPSRGLLNTPANEVRSVQFQGEYTATRIFVSGLLSEGVPSTWGSDARVAVYAPNGTITIVQPFTETSFEGQLVVNSFSTLLALPQGGAAGTWQFVFFEEVIDTDEGYDAIWDRITFTIDDDPPPGGWLEADDAGELITASQRCEGFGDLARIVGRILGPETDLYTIQICNPSQFSASTVGHATWDTQLFLFRQDGVGVTFNDDAPEGLSTQSTITSQFVTGPGEYLLGVSQFNRKPRSLQSQSLWLDDPARLERAPDGPAASAAFARWQAPSTWAGGTYQVDLTGVCFARPLRCPADLDDGNGQGVPDGAVDISDFLFFLVGFEAGSLAVDIDNGGRMGVHDGAVDISDLVYFLIRFEAGC